MGAYDNSLNVNIFDRDMWDFFAAFGQPLEIGKLYYTERYLGPGKDAHLSTPGSSYPTKGKFIIHEMTLNKYHEITSLALDYVETYDNELDIRGGLSTGAIRFNSTVPIEIAPTSIYSDATKILHVPVVITNNREVKQLDLTLINQNPMTFKLTNIMPADPMQLEKDILTPANAYNPMISLPNATFGTLFPGNSHYSVTLKRINSSSYEFMPGDLFVIDEKIEI